MFVCIVPHSFYVSDYCYQTFVQTEVKQEYDSLRKELQEVKQLEKEMKSTLSYQVQTMNQTFKILRKKIEANPAQYSAIMQRLAHAKIH